MKNVKWPAWVALVGAVVMALLTVVNAATADHTPTSVMWVQVGVAAVAAFNVWATANLPQYEHLKKYVMAVMTALQLLVTFVPGGMSSGEWINVAVALATGIGVMVVPHPLTRSLPGVTVVSPAGTPPPVAVSPVTVTGDSAPSA